MDTLAVEINLAFYFACLLNRAHSEKKEFALLGAASFLLHLRANVVQWNKQELNDLRKFLFSFCWKNFS